MNKIKSFVTMASLVLALLAGFFGLFSKIHADKMQNERDAALDELKVKTTESYTYRNELGQTVTQTIEYQKKISDLRNSNDKLEKKIYNQIKASQLKKKQLKSVVLVASESSGGGVFDSVQTILQQDKETAALDSVYHYNTIKFFNDGFLDLKVYEDSLLYSYRDSITIATAAQRVARKFFLWRWLGLKKLIDKDIVEVTFDNPVTINKIRYIKILP